MPTPVNSTYQTKTFPLLSVLDSREGSSTYDSIAINCLTEIVETEEGKEVHLIKRDGSEEIVASVSSSPIRGMFHDNARGELYVAIDTDIYIYDSSDFSLITTLAAAFASADSKVGFCAYLYEDGTSVVIATNGTVLNRIDNAHAVTTSATAVSTVGTWVATPIYYDGYLLLVKSGTGDCYNSDVNDPMTWTAGNFITAEISPDTVSDIAKINNYFVLFGRESIEYFYDAGNPTGTPFARNDVFVKLVGLLNRSIVSYGNDLYMVGRKNEGVPEVFVLEDFKLTPISTPAIRRWLVTATETVYGFLLSMNGHDMYVLRAGGRCFYYDITSKLWGRLGFQGSVSNFLINNAYIIDGTTGQESLFSITTDNAIYRFTPDVYQDNAVDFPVIFRTKRMNYGTNNNKFMSSMGIWADRAPSVGSIDVQSTDDDYLTYSTARSVDLDHERPNLQQWGRFRARAFKFTYTSNNPLRIRNIEIDINMGVT